MELQIANLSKTYKNGVKALDNVSLTISAGMYGLLGPNGAGKSTLMRTLATLQEPDSGSIRLGEIDVLKQKNEIRRRLGYLPQEFGVYPESPPRTCSAIWPCSRALPMPENGKRWWRPCCTLQSLWRPQEGALPASPAGCANALV